jgi:DNA-binding MltR family transcriptional regulator
MLKGFFRAIRASSEEILKVATKVPTLNEFSWEGTIIQDHLKPEEWQNFNGDLEVLIKQKNDRGVAILSHSFLDDRLRWLIEKKLISHLSNSERSWLLSGNGPLASYKARLEVAYAFGLIPKLTRDELQILGSIRNKFAHDFRKKSFDDPTFAPFFDRLRTIDLGGSQLPTGDLRMEYASRCFISMTVLFTKGQILIAQAHSLPNQQE